MQWSNHLEHDCCVTSFAHTFFCSYLGNWDHLVISAQLKGSIKIFISISSDSLEHLQTEYLPEPDHSQQNAQEGLNSLGWSLKYFHFTSCPQAFISFTLQYEADSALCCQDSHKWVSLSLVKQCCDKYNQARQALSLNVQMHEYSQAFFPLGTAGIKTHQFEAVKDHTSTYKSSR